MQTFATNRVAGESNEGTLRLVQTECQAHQAVLDGLILYTPGDAYMYVTLGNHERRLLRAFKRQFCGSVEWKSQ
jgi:hypothetical protein